MIHSTRSTKRRRAASAALPALCVAVALSACSASPKDSDELHVAAVIKGLDNPFFQAMEEGLADEAAAVGSVDLTVQAAADTSDTVGQADKLSALGVQDYSCYVVNPISGTNLIQTLTLMAGDDKTIVNIDSPLDPEAVALADLDVATYIGTDNNAAGGKAGTFLADAAGPGAEVAIVGGIAGDVTSAARVDGFKEAAGSLKVVAEVAADWKREIALTKATDIMAANPNIKAFFAANDDMGLGIAKAIENAGRTGDILVVSVDGNMDALESVAAGGLTATVAQYPFTIGSLGLQACQVAAAGLDLPATVESPTALVTQPDAEAAIAAFPQPFSEFDNPLETLLTTNR